VVLEGFLEGLKQVLKCFASKRRSRGASHYGRGVERTSDKLPLREQGRSPLKYINCRLCISFERKVCLVEENLSAIFMETQTLIEWTIFGAKTLKKCCHIDVLKALGHWPLASSVKAERTNFGSPPIKL
jgi:hypothetical protein